MKATVTPYIELCMDGYEAFLSIEDARALYNQLGEALGVFRPAPVVPIPIETIQPVGIPEREQDEIYQEWRNSLVVEPAQEPPEPCACQGDVSAPCADGLQDWEQTTVNQIREEATRRTNSWPEPKRAAFQRMTERWSEPISKAREAVETARKAESARTMHRGEGTGCRVAFERVMATDRPDWVPEGWEWNGRCIHRKAVDRFSHHIYRRDFFGRIVWQVNGLMCLSLKTALAIAELLAAERGGWA